MPIVTILPCLYCPFGAGAPKETGDRALRYLAIGVHIDDRVLAAVAIGVHSAGEANSVALDVAAEARVVIPKVVIM